MSLRRTRDRCSSGYSRAMIHPADGGLRSHEYSHLPHCNIRDPDGHLIEVGQTTDPDGDWTPPQWLSSTAAEES
jgi:hypothetical protein